MTRITLYLKKMCEDEKRKYEVRNHIIVELCDITVVVSEFNRLSSFLFLRGCAVLVDANYILRHHILWEISVFIIFYKKLQK